MVTAGGAKASGSVQLGFGPCPALVDNLDVVVEDGRNDGDHVSFDNACPDILGTSNSDVEDALKRQIPFPHVHHIFATALLEDAYQPLDAAIDGQDVSDAGRRGGEVGEVV